MKLLQKISHFRHLPITFRRVVGNSMAPTLADGDLVLFSPLVKPRENEIVIARIDDKEYIKRVGSLADDYVSLHGDNPYDSLNFPRLSKDALLGMVLWVKRRS